MSKELNFNNFLQVQHDGSKAQFSKVNSKLVAFIIEGKVLR